MRPGNDKPESLAVVGPGRVGTAIHACALEQGLEASLLTRGDLEASAPASKTPDTVILAVPDREIEGACSLVAAGLGSPRLIGHTSGATSLAALEPAVRTGSSAFSMHPLQTFPGEGASLRGAPCAVTASDESVAAEVAELAVRLGMTPFGLDDDARVGYHAAASIASNFLVALEEAAVEALERAGVPDGRALLSPLVAQTAANWSDRGAGALSGPIARGDEATVAAHLSWIESEYPEIADLYRALAERTRATAASGAAG